PDPRAVVRGDRRGGDARRLHGAADLPPLGAAPPMGRAHHPRLPVAQGDRLVLVLPRLRGPAPTGPSALPAPAATQRRLLADPARRAAVRPAGPVAGAGRAPAAGAGRPGRGDPAGPDRRVPALVPRHRPDRAAVAVPRAAARRPAVAA